MQPAVFQTSEDCLVYPFSHLSTLHHLHASYEILVPYSGIVRARIDSEERIVKPGEMLVLFPGIPHSYAQSEDAEGLMILFTGKLLSDSAEEWQEMHPAQPIIPLSSVDWDVTYCLDRMATMSTIGEIDEALAQAYLSLMFVWLAPALSLTRNARTVNTDLLYRAMQYMTQNMSQPLSLRTTARALGVNTYYLSHVLNERLHMGFRAYLNALRIDRARRYLRVTSRSIEEIAVACGFTNLRTFDRVFAERCQCTPRDFRKAAAALREKQLTNKAKPSNR